MPGFAFFNNNGPSAKLETYRDHRFLLESMFDINISTNKELYQVKDMTLSSKEVGTFSITTIGTTYNFANKVSYSDLKISFYADQDLLNRLLEMESYVHTINDGILDFAEYKGDIVVKLFKDGFARSNFKFTYKGCILSNVDYGQVSYESSAIKMVTVTCKIDYYTTESVT